MEVLNYKCPNCTAPLKYTSEKNNWTCESCDSVFDLETLQKIEEMEQSKISGRKEEWEEYTKETGSGDWTEEEAEQLTVYNCPSCGAEIIADENTAATECYYCHNQAIIPKKLSGAFKPDYIIPFSLNKEDAKKAYNKHISGKFLLPNDFKANNVIEKLNGIYVPFWLYDADTDADILYRATRSTSWRQGDYMITKTDHFSVRREGVASFAKVPVDGSRKIDDALMESIEPFDYSKLEDFSMAYLSGFLADKYDVDSKENLPRISERMKASIENLLRDTVRGYATVSVSRSNVDIDHGNVSYALLPVWLMFTKYKDKMYTFAMNAQTGKFIGDLPYDKGKFWKLMLGIMFGIPFVITLIVAILMSGGVL
ncbi:MAG: hypothetical protein IJC39_01725 [Firmicutes bacterium]|nr:hypothetical protein [Bacillota bacterium]